MAIPEIRLEQSLRTTQQMILSPQMQQAIQILQMPLMELRLKVSQEMAENPLLEENTEINETLEDTVVKAENNSGETLENDNDNFETQFKRLADLDDEWRDYFKQTYSVKRHTAQDEEKRRFLEASISINESLYEHLMQQLHLLSLDLKTYKIAEYLIGSIDEQGYLRTSTDEIALTLSIPEEEVESVLSKIQQFTPLGVGARNLKECLFLQLNTNLHTDLNGITSTVRNIVENHLEDLARHRFPHIAKALQVSIEEVQKSAEHIRTLEAKPGRTFTQEMVNYVIPDIFIEENVNGEFEVILNNDRIPHLRISNVYRTMMGDEKSSHEDKNYIQNKVRSGMWFIRNIHQRQQTIYNIMTKIVAVQKNFLRDGVGFLEPLTMQAIATPLNIHESTVSRAISKKYVQTPQGLFPVKYFFSVEMKTLTGESISARNIKQRVADIIHEEDSKNPLSDQDIIMLLEKESIQMARRTVAKYRKELRIPSSNMRKRY
jgi:RNA polymerase sigma-54 factor